ncbi:MAG: Rieske (2Fe-2S) protein [Myxococcota bacterium]
MNAEEAVRMQMNQWVQMPWNRREYDHRLGEVLARYDAALDPDGVQLGQLLTRFPTGAREAKAHSAKELRARRAKAEAERGRLRAGAPLPPDDDSARWVFSVADLQWILLELRGALRRASGARTLEGAIQGHMTRPGDDHLPLTVEGLAGWKTIVPYKRLSLVIEAVERRFSVSNLRLYLFTSAPELDVGALEEFPLGSPRELRVGPLKLAAIRVGDHVRVLDGICPHRGGSLSDGWVEGGALVCPVHAWAFDLRTGEERSHRDAIRVYPTRVEDGRVWLTPSHGDS